MYHKFINVSNCINVSFLFFLLWLCIQLILFCWKGINNLYLTTVGQFLVNVLFSRESEKDVWKKLINHSTFTNKFYFNLFLYIITISNTFLYYNKMPLLPCLLHKSKICILRLQNSTPVIFVYSFVHIQVTMHSFCSERMHILRGIRKGSHKQREYKSSSKTAG